MSDADSAAPPPPEDDDENVPVPRLPVAAAAASAGGKASGAAAALPVATGHHTTPPKRAASHAGTLTEAQLAAHAEAHKSPAPHYSLPLSQMDKALLELPPFERVQANLLVAENGTLRARCKALTQELADARDIFTKRGRMFVSRLGHADVNKTVQTLSIKGLIPLRQLKRSKDGVEQLLNNDPTHGTQTDESYLSKMASLRQQNDDDNDEEKAAAAAAAGSGSLRKSRSKAAAAADAAAKNTTKAGEPKDFADIDPETGRLTQAALLKAELLKVKAECSSLQHSIELLRASGNSSPERQQEVQLAHSNTMRRVDELYRALCDSIAKVSAAEQQVSEMRASMAGGGGGGSSGAAGSPGRRKTPDSSSSGQHLRPVAYNKSSNTDRVLDMHVSSIPNGAPPPARDANDASSDYVMSLERVLESTRAQLSAALKQLEESSDNRGPPSSAVSAVSDRLLGGRRSVAVSTGQSIASRVEDLFAQFKVPFSVDVVEDLLKNKDAPLKVLELQAHAQQRHMDAGAASAMSAALAGEVDTLRGELVASHVAMDEMQYSLDLERRAGAGSNVAANQSAARDIAVLCDTVHASKAEIDNLRNQLKEVTRERNMAVSDFRQLQDHFRAALVTSEQMIDAQQDSSAEGIRKLTQRLQQQESEAIALRAEASSDRREIDKLKKARDAALRDVQILRERTTQMQTALAQLRTEHMAQAHELRALKSGASPAAAATADARKRGSSAGASRRTTPATAGGAAAGGAAAGAAVTLSSAAANGGASRNVGVTRGSSGAMRHSSQSELEAQYEELRTCFLDLAALVPGDLQTARQVAQCVVKEFRALQARVAHLEKDLKKRMANMEQAKKSVEDARTRQLQAEQRSRTMQTQAKRAVHGKKVAEEAARAFDSKVDTMDASREELAAKVETLESELEATREALVSTRHEVELGRKMMLQLINDDSELGLLTAAAESKSSGSPL